MRKQKTSSRKARASDALPPVPDRRAFERSFANIHKVLEEQQFGSVEEANAFLQQLTASGQIPERPAETPLEKAQDLMYAAFEASGKRRVALARQALEVSPDCADAYVLLAEESARTPQEARELYERGVQAGERALGPETFAENVGDFWGLVETRPYMRARAGLASTLWMLGEHKAAIAHVTDMLRLNPGDNQGVRYWLAHWLSIEGDDKALDELLNHYKDDASAEWAYTRVLWTFRRTGGGPKATSALKKALEANPFVPLYLLGVRKLPQRLPEYIGFGDENEAVSYVTAAVEAWLKSSDALGWLATEVLRLVLPGWARESARKRE